MCQSPLVLSNFQTPFKFDRAIRGAAGVAAGVVTFMVTSSCCVESREGTVTGNGLVRGSLCCVC